MSRKNRHYAPQFKREALEMLATGKYSMAQIERDLGITKGLLQKWRYNAERKGEYKFPQTEATTPEATVARVRQLERDNERLRQEREILKKAMAIFSSRKE